MRVIAGHHDDFDTGFPAAANRGRHFRTWWIFEADEGSHHKVLLGLGQNILAGKLAMGEREHAKSAIRHFRRYTTKGRAGFACEWLLASASLDPARPREELFWRSLYEQHHLAWIAMHGGETLALGLKRDLVRPIVTAIAASRLCKLDERNFHRVADPGEVGTAGTFQVMTVIGALQEPSVRRRESGSSGVGRRDELIWQVDAADAHPILCERSRFVGADHSRGSESLDAWQVANERLTSRHATRRHCHCQRDGRQEALWYVRDDDANRKDETDGNRQPDECANDEHDEPDGDCKSGDQATEMGDILLKWRWRFARTLCETSDSAEYRVHSSGENHCLRFARRHRSAGQHHVAAS